MSNEVQDAAPNEAPRGMYSGRIDDKGRLKLPASFQSYFAALPEKKLFVTSLDRSTAQIYTMAVWRQNEKFFDDYLENPAAARRALFNANDLGAESEMDGQGRILFSPELRRALGIENSTVRLYSHRGHIEVLSDAEYQKRLTEASESPQATLEILERAGLK